MYLIQHPELPAVKVGVSGKREKGTRKGRYGRLEIHQGRGWIVHGMWEFSAGAHAEEIESTVLAWWREDLGAPIALSADQIPQRGETETAWLADVVIDETVAFIDRLVAAD